MTGWDLAREVENTIGQFWSLTRSQVYRELRTLEEMGYVEAGEIGRRERQPYTITDEGRAAFATWIKREPGPDTIRSPLLLTVFFGEHLDWPHLKRTLLVHRLRHEEQLRFYEAVLDALGTDEPHVQAVVRYGVIHTEGVLRWFDEVEARLQEADADKDQPGRKQRLPTASSREAGERPRRPASRRPR
jgi:DNA-binding PadR family transcriptional regulator